VIRADALHVKSAVSQSKTEFVSDVKRRRMNAFVKNNSWR